VTTHVGYPPTFIPSSKAVKSSASASLPTTPEKRCVSDYVLSLFPSKKMRPEEDDETEGEIAIDKGKDPEVQATKKSGRSSNRQSNRQT
jgi:hypothetical protein